MIHSEMAGHEQETVAVVGVGAAQMVAQATAGSDSGECNSLFVHMSILCKLLARYSIPMRLI